MKVGIDLGTTHSLIAYFGDDGPTLIPNALGDFLTPSAVAIDGDTVIVGRAAKDRLISHNAQSVATFKRWMGSARTTCLGQHDFRPEQLSAFILRSLLDDAQNHLGQEITEAVISVPAYFSDAQRKATRLAGQMAGVKVDWLINEPTAAALAYGLNDLGREVRSLVFDLGGGTLDVSILDLFDGVVEVRASAGDNCLGGEDFLELLYKDFVANHLPDGDSHLEPGAKAQLLRKLELGKHLLSTQAEIEMEIVLVGIVVNWRLSQIRFQQLAEPLLQRMRRPLERAMRDTKFKPHEIEEVILVGGACRMPMVAQLVTRMMGKLPLRHINPDHAIALGAAVAAGMRANDTRLKEMVLTDVCPYTLGTEVGQFLNTRKVENGYFHPILHRNCAVPVSREDVFYPLSDTQSVMHLGVYQGESPWVKENIMLGELQVPIDPEAPPADKGVSLRFTYDANGILHVEAKQLSTQKHFELVLQQGEATMSEVEVRERIRALDSLRTHPREQQANVALLARAARLYEEHILDRPDIQQWMHQFKQVLETQDLKRVEEHREALAQRLDGLEAQK
jgi:molecular chaperone HscC